MDAQAVFSIAFWGVLSVGGSLVLLMAVVITLYVLTR